MYCRTYKRSNQVHRAHTPSAFVHTYLRTCIQNNESTLKIKINHLYSSPPKIAIFYCSGHEAKAACLLRTEVMQYLLIVIKSVIIIQRIVRGFVVRKRISNSERDMENSAIKIQGFFLVFMANNISKKLKYQQVRFNDYRAKFFYD